MKSIQMSIKFAQGINRKWDFRWIKESRDTLVSIWGDFLSFVSITKLLFAFQNKRYWRKIPGMKALSIMLSSALPILRYIQLMWFLNGRALTVPFSLPLLMTFGFIERLGQELTVSTVIASCSSFAAFHFSLLILGALMRDNDREGNTIDSRW